MVSFYPSHFDSITLTRPIYLDTSTFHANEFDPLSKELTLYSTLSNIGMAHKSMRFRHPGLVGFDLDVPAFASYIKTQKDLKIYLSLLPYSEIRYVMTSGDKEQHLNFKFGRQFLQGLFLSFDTTSTIPLASIPTTGQITTISGLTLYITPKTNATVP